MNRVKIYLMTLPATALMALLLSGCSISVHSSKSRAISQDDTYASHDRGAILAERDEVQRSNNEYYDQYVSNKERQTLASKEERNNNKLAINKVDYNNVLVNDHQTAYARRLNAFSTPTYNLPDSYYTLRYSDYYNLLLNYDPNYYNVIVVGNQVWVEPKHISSLYGFWGTSVSIAYLRSPWFSYYGWGGWGWNNWGWSNWGWNSWGWGGGYYPHHHHGHNSWGGSSWGGQSWGHNYGPTYRPGYGGSPGGSGVRPGGVITRPGGGTTRPVGTGERPVVGRPTESITRPGGVITRPGGGTTRPVGTGERPVVGRPTESITRPGGAITRPGGSTTSPGGVTVHRPGGVDAGAWKGAINPRPISTTDYSPAHNVGRPSESINRPNRPGANGTIAQPKGSDKIPTGTTQFNPGRVGGGSTGSGSSGGSRPSSGGSSSGGGGSSRPSSGTGR